LAPAAGPGWEEPTSQLYPRFLPELDYVFTHEHSWGRRMIASLVLAHPKLVSQPVGTDRVPLRRIPRAMFELAAKPSHYAHFCALSRYGVTTERPDLRPTCVGQSSVASGMLGKTQTVSGSSGSTRSCACHPRVPDRTYLSCRMKESRIRDDLCHRRRWRRSS
jgi:hypothetical protein